MGVKSFLDVVWHSKYDHLVRLHFLCVRILHQSNENIPEPAHVDHDDFSSSAGKHETLVMGGV